MKDSFVGWSCYERDFCSQKYYHHFINLGSILKKIKKIAKEWKKQEKNIKHIITI